MPPPPNRYTYNSIATKSDRIPIVTLLLCRVIRTLVGVSLRALLVYLLLPIQCSYAGSPPTNGSYGPPIYSGGTQTTFQFPGGTKYGLQTSGYGGGGSGPASCSGDITVKFIWDPGSNNSPPPDAVIVEQTCNASWFSPVQDGSCDDGLGNSEQTSSTPTPYGPYPVMYSGVSKGTSYSSVKPASDGSITIHCSPFASCPFFGPSQATVWYSASICNPLVVSGVTSVNGQDEILSGQLCNATLQLPGGFTCSSCDWSISGTNYSNWNVTTPIGPEPMAVTPLSFTYSPNVSTCTSPNWYWDDTVLLINKETVSCTADLIAPDKTTFTASFSKNVTELAPTSTMLGTVGTSSIYKANSGSNPYWIQLAGLNDGQGYDLTYTVTQPTEFISPGESAIAQLASSKVIDAPPTYTLSLIGLDGSFPYGYGGKGIADGSKTIMTDAPDTACKTFTSVSVSDYFDDYLMYLPPADSLGPSVWVPLRDLTWQWSASASKPSGGWGNPVKITENASVGSSSPTNQYPTWITWIPASN